MDFFKTFGWAFWSPLAYKKALKWRWKLLGYFLLLSLFVAILSSIAVRPYYDEFLNSNVKIALKDMESFDFVDGKIKTKDGKDYAYDFPNDVGFLYLSEGINESPKEYFISIENDKLIVSEQIFLISDLMQGFNLDKSTIDKDLVFKYIDALMSIYYVIMIPMMFFSAVLSNVFFVVILSLAAFTMLMNSPLKLGYIAGLKMSILAITPMVFFQSVGAFVSLQDSAGFLYGLISIFLIWYMIKKLPAYFEDETQL